ncbi:hypothetical protein BRC83_00240 [Halobacteriales archaeon QS_1_68_17]|nr:MAG: hypothetical protein BRC83_00240 [Halobacteriales archaeon QS_1_68_17]
MAPPADRSGLDDLFKLLVGYRLLIYLAGTVAIGTPLFLAVGFGIEVSSGVRTAIVVASLGGMILTYAGERRVGLDGEAAGPGDGGGSAEYPLRKRAAVALAVVGVAVGVYAGIEVNPILGLVFVGGALLFGRFAYGDETGSRNDAGNGGT